MHLLDIDPFRLYKYCIHLCAFYPYRSQFFISRLYFQVHIFISTGNFYFFHNCCDNFLSCMLDQLNSREMYNYCSSIFAFFFGFLRRYIYGFWLQECSNYLVCISRSYFWCTTILLPQKYTMRFVCSYCKICSGAWLSFCYVLINWSHLDFLLPPFKHWTNNYNFADDVETKFLCGVLLYCPWQWFHVVLRLLCTRYLLLWYMDHLVCLTNTMRYHQSWLLRLLAASCL